MWYFLDYMVDQFNYIGGLMSTDLLWLGADFLTILIMFYVVYQVLYMLIIRPSNSPGLISMASQIKSNTKSKKR